MIYKVVMRAVSPQMFIQLFLIMAES